METKVCFKCGRELPISEFYNHVHMKDGHLNKCISCTKRDESERYARKSKDPFFVESERKRGREKYHRLGYRNKRTDRSIEKEMNFPALRSAKKSLNVKLPAEIELHHWDYNNNECVIALDRRLHHRLHTFISLNIKEGIYYFKDERLDTLEKHLNVIHSVCENLGFDFNKVQVISK